MTDTTMLVTPLVQIVLPDSERVVAFSELVGDLSLDPATISDKQLVERATAYLDRPEGSLSSYVVSRPSSGNILISPRPTFG